MLIKGTGFLVLSMFVGASQFIVFPAQATDKSFQPVYVYKDKPSANHFTASGFMPDGKCVEINDAWTDNCGKNRSCIQNKFKRECAARGIGWAGVYWLRPANNWGNVKGGLDLTGATRLIFWARGEKGGEMVTFKMGGVGMAYPYPDSDTAVNKPIVLTNEWKEYSIELKGKDLKHIIGGFAWLANAGDNQSDSTFYLANIYYN